MASVRSISASKSPERLLARRIQRTSTPTSALSQKKLSLPKTTSIALSTSRQKPSRMSLKKGSAGSITSPARLNSCNTTISVDNIELTTSKMAITTLHDSPSSRLRSRISDITDTSVSRDKHVEDNNETLLSNNNNFSLESFDTIRTVGTGKKSSTKKISLNILSYLGTFGRVQVVHHRDTNTYYALKTMSIKRIVESKQIEHVRNEKNILSKITHPFLVRLYWTTHTNNLLYLLLEYLPGGELFQMMRKREKFDSKTAIFYASEVLLALDYLHHLDILYRDLKPVKEYIFLLHMIYHLFFSL